MASRREVNQVTRIDPIFYVPEEMDDYEYAVVSEEINDILASDFTGGVLDGGLVTYPVDDGDLTGSGIRPPRTITIIEQRIRTGPSGAQVVDLIIDIEDVPGAVGYDFRVDVA